MAATTIALDDGNEQVGQVSQELENPLAVLVTDADGNPVPGQSVAWAIGAGSGTLSAASSSTNADGVAEIDWTLGPATGPQVVTATVNGLTGSPVVFTATATLVTVQKVKDYLRIETDAEDDLIADLIVRAEADIEGVVGQSLTKRQVTWRDDARTLRLYDVVSNLQLRSTPIDASTVVVTDGSGDEIDSDLYEVRQDLGLICAKGFGSAGPFPGQAIAFDNGPYTIACMAGFATGDTYATRELPIIQANVIDFVGMLYQQRTPGARSEGAAGTRVDYEVDEATGLPKRIARSIRNLRGIIYGTP